MRDNEETYKLFLEEYYKWLEYIKIDFIEDITTIFSEEQFSSVKHPSARLSNPSLLRIVEIRWVHFHRKIQDWWGSWYWTTFLGWRSTRTRTPIRCRLLVSKSRRDYSFTSSVLYVQQSIAAVVYDESPRYWLYRLRHFRRNYSWLDVTRIGMSWASKSYDTPDGSLVQ